MTETRNQLRIRELARIKELEDVGDKLVAKVSDLEKVNEARRVVIVQKDKLLNEREAHIKYLEGQLTDYSQMGTAQAEELSKLRAFKAVIKELVGLTD